MTDRRTFLAVFASIGIAPFSIPRSAGAAGAADRRWGPHPDPRSDVDASRVLTADQLQDFPEVIEVYDGIRAIPHVADGIRCMCGCATIPGYRSLLTCYEEGGMAKTCLICQNEARVVIRLHGAGRTLDQIRAVVDARFG